MPQIELISEFMEKLNSFSNSDEIAQFLTDENVRGYKGDSDSCVITHWLENNTGFDVSTEDEIRFYTTDPMDNLECWSVVDITPAVKSFIEEFDNGKFPQLELGDSSF